MLREMGSKSDRGDGDSNLVSAILRQITGFCSDPVSLSSGMARDPLGPREARTVFEFRNRVEFQSKVSPGLQCRPLST